jgi:molybdate transport system substrate-binding protein
VSIRVISKIKFFALCTALALISGQLAAAEIRVATASNFSIAMTAIVAAFETTSTHKVLLSFGSTGKHYAQIRNGAPFDAFFAADGKRPELLEQAGQTVPGSRFTYAVGKLVLWSPQPAYVDAQGEILHQGEFRHLAMANPKLAPYGQAAREILQAQGLWDQLNQRLVRGENIAQAFQFVMSGNAELGFVAWSQLHHPGRAVEGSYWEVPQSLYTPIRQQAVLLSDKQAGREFMAYLQSKEAMHIILQHGYGTP